MYDGVRATNEGAALYFLFIVIIGNYVVLNLFLAILLEQFSGGAKDEDSQLQEETEKGNGEGQWDNHEHRDALEATAADPLARMFRPLHEPIKIEPASRDEGFKKRSLSVHPTLPRTPSRMFLHQAVDPETISDMLEGRSLFIFGPQHPLRVFLAMIVWHPRFEQLIITLIMMSSIVLAIDSPSLDEDGALKAALVRIPWSLAA